MKYYPYLLFLSIYTLLNKKDNDKFKKGKLRLWMKIKKS